MAAINQDIQHRLLTARLPALPQVLLNVLALCRREDAGLDDIARLIQQDPALCTRLISLLQSAEHHGSRLQQGLMQTLMQLGLDTVRITVINDAIQQVFSQLNAQNELDLSDFWRHSLSAAFLARRLAKASGYPHVEEAYLAGLLHDIGQLAMTAVFPNEYRRAFAEHQDDTWLSNWEEMTVGMTHAEVGGWLAGRWQLESFLVDAVLYHHETAEYVAAAHPLVRIVWLAHAVERNDLAPVPSLIDAGDLDFDTLRAEAAAATEQAARYLGLDLAEPASMAAADNALRDEVRDLAMIGGLRSTPASPATMGTGEDLRGLVLAAQSLFGLGQGLLYQPHGERLQAVSPWPHLRRAEELPVPLAALGGLVAQAALTGLSASGWQTSSDSALLDDQILRLLSSPSGDEVPLRLVCLPLGTALPAPILVFAASEEAATALLGRPALVTTFLADAAQRLASASPPADSSDRIRRAVHEANNPLGIIKNYLHVLGQQADGTTESSLHEDLEVIRGEIDRVSRILRQLAHPEKSVASQKTPVDLNANVASLLRFCQDTRFIPPGIRVDTALQTDIPPVGADRDSLKQILLNLLKNAVEALGDKGTITISTAGPVLRDQSPFVVLRIEDDGPGLPAEVQARLFSPVQSSKGEGHSGLGLSIVGDLVKRVGGQISALSRDHGCAFEIHIPASDNPASAAS